MSEETVVCAACGKLTQVPWTLEDNNKICFTCFKTFTTPAPVKHHSGSCKICGTASFTTVCQDCDAEYCSTEPRLLEQTRAIYGYHNIPERKN